MLSAFKSIFGRGPSTSAAKNRLQMVLVQDRSGISSSDMEDFKSELLAVISKYFTMDNNNLDVSWERTDSETALVINTPIRGKLKAVKNNKSSKNKKKARA